MNIRMDDIFEFSKLRIACHVRALNYFASLFGYNFPDHDSDKNTEPMRTGYAYIIYAMYHKNFHLLFEHEQLCRDAKDIHHKYAPHHTKHYQNVADIPDIRLYEMICDWASANFEQKNILCVPGAIGLTDWVEQNQLKLKWTPHQLDLIKTALKTINEKTDVDALHAIWQPALDMADL